MKHIHLPKNLALLLLACFIASAAAAQSVNYIATDTATTMGVRLMNEGARLNAQFCHVLVGKDTVRYSPHQIKEYGFINGQIYVSREIIVKGSPKKVFLEQLVAGKASLYYYEDSYGPVFFIEKKGQSLIELVQTSLGSSRFRAQLAEFTSDCKQVEDAVRVVSYTKSSLSTLIQRYNNCELKPFPMKKFGLHAGVGASRLSPSSAQEDMLINLFDFRYDKSFVLGAFMSFPIAQSDFSAFAELMFQKTSYSYEAKDIIGGNVVAQYIEFNNTKTMLLLPVMARYTYPSNRIRPYVNVGLQVSYTLNNTNSFIERKNTSHNPLHALPVTIPSPGFGHVWGAGLEIRLDHRRHVFVDFRSGQLYNVKKFDDLREMTSGVFLGINF